MRCWRTIYDGFTFFNMLAFKYIYMTPLWYKFFILLTICIGYHQPLLTLGVFTKTYSTRDLCQHSRLFGLSGFKQVCNPWKTTGNITGLERLLRQPCNNITHLYFLTVGNSDNCLGWQGILGWNIGSRNLQFLTFAVHQFNHRAHVFCM